MVWFGNGGRIKGEMKMAGIILILFSCSGLGFHLAWSYSRRISECRQIERCLQCLAGEIRFLQLPLTEALHLTEGEAGGFRDFLTGLAQRMESCDGGSFQKLWEQELERYLQSGYLKEEAELLFYLGRQLGNLDLEEQVKTLSRFLEQWREQIEILREQEKTKGRLYRYLGVFAGFFLAILLA